jgi:hypothetical protein
MRTEIGEAFERLVLEHSRKCWVDAGGHRYDGGRFERMHSHGSHSTDGR